MKIKNTWRGFTLIELLVVVLIIGVLAAIALPMYQKAVLKSRFAALMPIAKAVSEGNEHYYLNHNVYATDPTELDVVGQEEYSDGTELDLVNEGDYSYVIATRAQVNNNPFPNNYIVYQKHSGKFADNIHCEALEGNAQANEVCISFGGEYIPGSQTDGFVTYVLSGNPGTDRLPSSLTKLANTVCGEDTNCTAHVEGDTVVSESCTGTLTSISGSKTCINKTYDDTGAQVNYEKIVQSCSSFSNDAYSNASKCYTSEYDEENQLTGSITEVCNLNAATWNNGVCTQTGVGTYYSYDKNEGDKYWSDLYICNNITCSSGQENHHSPERDVVFVFYTDSMGQKRASNTSRWDSYADNTRTTVSFPYENGQAFSKFTTKDRTTNEVTNTITCAISNADWETGTCKEGTAI